VPNTAGNTDQHTKKRKIPERKCLGCGVSKPKKELLRVVRDPEGNLSLDFTGKKSGRGAYICRDNIQCFKKARKSKRMGHSLECEIPEEIYDLLEAELVKNGT
jgi:predicted RNA-binding protein YlxR (DUF448 family)